MTFILYAEKRVDDKYSSMSLEYWDVKMNKGAQDDYRALEREAWVRILSWVGDRNVWCRDTSVVPGAGPAPRRDGRQIATWEHPPPYGYYNVLTQI